MLNRASSQICDSWHLPMFLFRNGSFTLKSIASFIAPVRLCDSLPTILDSSMMACDVTMFIIRVKGFEIFSNPLSKGSSRFFYILFITLYSVTFVQGGIHKILAIIISLSLCGMNTLWNNICHII